MPAILGSSPMFPQMLNIVRPVFPDLAEFDADFRTALGSGQVTNNSRFVVEFEQQLSAYLGVDHALVFNNGETALIVMLKAAIPDGGPGREVIVPSYTFSGTAHAVVWAGLTPVFADIDPETFTIDPADVERRITPRTVAILAAPVYGNPCDNAALQEVAARHRITLLYDSASGFGCTYRGVRLGRFGKAEIFSFHATKTFSTMEGGLLTTNDGDLATLVKQYRSFGQSGPVDCSVAGLNGKMMEISALVGMRFLRTFDAQIAHRARVSEEYARLLAPIPGLRLQTVRQDTTSSRLYLSVVVDEQRFGLSRNDLVEALASENVTARKFLDPPVHRMTCYRSLPAAQLPETDRIAAHAMALPLYSDMTVEEVSGICRAIAGIHADAGRVKRHLAQPPAVVVSR